MEQDGGLHVAIKSAMQSAGLEPVEFDKPLKSVWALYKCRKEVKPKNILQQHSAIGWSLGNLIDHFEKELWSIKSLTMLNTEDSITTEAVICLSGLTFEEDHVAWLDGLAEFLAGEDIKAWGYHYYAPPYFKWDSVERIGPVGGATQMRGDGEKTGNLEPTT